MSEKYDYLNRLNRLTQADGSYWVYQYDALGQVVSGKKYWSDGSSVAGQQFAYAFDDIGNRKSASEGGNEMGLWLRTANYTGDSTLLNQYAQRTVPAAMDVTGTANPNATLTINGVRASRYGSYFRAEVPVTNGLQAVWNTVTSSAILNNSPTTDLTTNAVGNVFVPRTPENFVYDADGNLTSDGRWTYTWDPENRLLTVTANTAVGPQLSINFEYDWQGRRIHKQVWNNTQQTGTPTLEQKYVYDGWNLIATLNSSSAITAAYTWGSDLSGSLQGAGGVGGLLFVAGNNAQDFVACDGNGNVTMLVNAANGTTDAQYDYDPFGRPMRVVGPTARTNPFRFSTKFTDDETDLVYYGYRYYSPNFR